MENVSHGLSRYGTGAGTNAVVARYGIADAGDGDADEKTVRFQIRDTPRR